MANSPMRNSRRAMVTHPDKRSGVSLNQALELMTGVLPREFESWDEVPANYQSFRPKLGANLPTPMTSDQYSDKMQSTQQKKGSMHSVTLAQAVQMSFGKFEPAIKTWEEKLGLAAPAPTEPDGREGAHRLSSKFTEWMMGLKPGWVTSHGLSRKDELKLCGNGVVPQQAKLALAILKKRLDVVA